MYTIIGADGNEYGPVTAAVINDWITSGRANAQTKIKREGETDWTTVGAVAEFANTPPPQPAAMPAAPGGAAPTPAAANATGGDAPSGEFVSFHFSGEWTEYFKIWIINVLLTIVTLGVYAAWAKVKNRRYIYANTRLFGHAFEYMANPVRILIGNIIVVALFFSFSIAGAISPLLQLPFLLALLIAIPWFIVRTFVFNARNTAWRGLRFHFHGRYGQAAKAFILWPMLLPFTLGLVWPLVIRRQREFILNQHSYGKTPFEFTALTADLYSIFFRAILFFLPLMAGYAVMFTTMILRGAVARGGHPTMPPFFAIVAGSLFIIGVPLAIAGGLYLRTRLFNYTWNMTTIGGYQFVAAMRARDLFGVQLLNAIVTVVTCGLLYPWAALRMVKFQLDSVQVVSAGNIDQFVAGAQPPPGSAIGEAATDLFDIDIGIGV
jgi:uncharacterized membrane protein YjgN (DUF898 family)